MLTQDERKAIQTAMYRLIDSALGRPAEASQTLEALLEKDKEAYPQPIATAPTDGTPVLTDSGVCQHGSYLGDGKKSSWLACEPAGDLLETDGDHIFVSPTLWTPLPDWMKKIKQSGLTA